jgi:hypothetical protein
MEQVLNSVAFTTRRALLAAASINIYLLISIIDAVTVLL